jgi:hypothetical protein
MTFLFFFFFLVIDFLVIILLNISLPWMLFGSYLYLWRLQKFIMEVVCFFAFFLEFGGSLRDILDMESY